jgi:hypothetical protein
MGLLVLVITNLVTDVGRGGHWTVFGDGSESDLLLSETVCLNF